MRRARSSATSSASRCPPPCATSRAWCFGRIAPWTQRPARICPLERPVRRRNPYKGLSPFGEADARDFFGREGLSRELVDRLLPIASWPLSGRAAAGSPRLFERASYPLLRQRRPRLAAWPIVELSPGERPLEELEAALLRIAVNPPVSLMEQLASDERGLCRAVKRILPAERLRARPRDRPVRGAVRPHRGRGAAVAGL